MPSIPLSPAAGLHGVKSQLELPDELPETAFTLATEASHSPSLFRPAQAMVRLRPRVPALIHRPAEVALVVARDAPEQGVGTDLLYRWRRWRGIAGSSGSSPI